jgi:hypothetical protein
MSATTTAHDDGRTRSHDEDGQYYIQDDHAVSTSFGRLTRWLTTFEEAPGTIVTP